MINKVKTLLIIGLIVFIVSLLWQNRTKQDRLDKLTFEKGVMAENLRTQVVIEKDKIVYKDRISGNNEGNSKGNIQSKELAGAVEEVEAALKPASYTCRLRVKR
jgi:hypothetical protein